MSEAAIRLTIFIVIFASIALVEILHPCREQRAPQKKYRWLNNLGIAVLDTVFLRILFPAAAVGFALWAEANGWGLMHWLNAPLLVSALVSFMFLDLVIYTQHVIFHKVPFFWRFHQMHHSDTEYDITTGLRFHPIEILFSMVIKAIAIILIGAPVVAVIVFEAVLNASAIFNHGNFSLSKKVDAKVRLIIVTPDMHRIHHSSWQKETDSNYGFNFPWWDRIFGTYIESPRDPQESMQIGLGYFRETKDSSLLGLLKQPFRKIRRKKSEASSNVSSNDTHK